MTAKRRAELETLKDAVLAPATRATIEELLAEIDSLKADNKRLATMASDTAPAFAKLQLVWIPDKPKEDGYYWERYAKKSMGKKPLGP